MTIVHSAIIDGVEAVPVTITAERAVLHHGIVIRRGGFKHSAQDDADFFKEARVRLRAALISVGIDNPNVTVTIDFGGYEPKRGQCIGLDLPIAMAVAGGAGVDGVMAFGELSLGGQVRTVRGAFSVAELGQKRGTPAILGDSGPFMPSHYRVATLGQALENVRHLAMDNAEVYVPAPDDHDLGDIALSPENHRKLAAAIVAGLGITLAGPPGSGKTMLARRLAALHGPPTGGELRELRRIYSAAGMPAPRERPFRAPHHTASEGAFTGKTPTAPPRPGEVALAHKGVLFLDELTEYRKSTLEMLGRELKTGAYLPTLVVAAHNADAHPGSVERIQGFLATHCSVRIHLPRPAPEGAIRKSTETARAELEAARARHATVDPTTYENAPQGGNPRFERAMALAIALAKLDAAPSVTQVHIDEAASFLDGAR